MKSSNYYPIRYVSRHTGLPAYLIRTWELRYAAVSPQRSNSNRRLYCIKDIKRLQLLSKAVASGHSISQVANLSHAELVGLIDSDSSETNGCAVEAKMGSLSADTYYSSSLDLVVELDTNGLQATLDRAAVNLTRMALILDVIVPLYTMTKELVQTGKLKFINLNVATMVLQTFLWDMLRTAVVSESAPKIVVAAPTGQQSEIEALALALIGVESGWRSIYFGPNLPANDISAAVKSNRVRAVGLIINHFKDKSSVETEITKLRDNLNGGIDILVCANSNLSMDYLAKLDGISVTKLKNFRRKLESLTTANLS